MLSLVGSSSCGLGAGGWGQPELTLSNAFVKVICFGFPGGSDGKATACNAGDLGLIPRPGRSPGEGKATHSSTLA